MLAQGTPLHVVSESLGHASTTITKDVYQHLLGGDRRAVAASMSLGAVRTRYGGRGFQHGSQRYKKPLPGAGRGL